MSLLLIHGVLQPPYIIIPVQVAIAAALPDIAVADVIIPQGVPAAQFAYTNYSNFKNATLGAVIAINTPFTVNTTNAINTYLSVSN